MIPISEAINYQNVTNYNGVDILPITQAVVGKEQYGYVCTINQINMISQLEKIPNYIFWFLVASFIGFMLHFYLEPRIKNKSWFKYLGEEQFLMFSYMMLSVALTFLFFFTFKIDMERFEVVKIVVIVSLILMALWIAKRVYQYYVDKKAKEYGFDIANLDLSKVDFGKIMKDLNSIKEDIDKESKKEEENEKDVADKKDIK